MRLLADTGASVNLLKKTASLGFTTIEERNIIKGISSTPIYLSEICFVPIRENRHVFLIVPDDFPITTDGIIGCPFLEDEDALVDAKNRVIIFRKKKPKFNEVLNIKPYLPEHDRLKLLLENTRMDHIGNKDRQSIWQIISSYSDVYTLPGDPLPATNLTNHKITLTEDKVINQKQYRYPEVHKEEVEKQINDMLEKEIIKPSNSPYNSPLWIVPKKTDASGKKKWRIVIDFRKLNDLTKQDSYPLPNIDEILDKLGKARYFSAFDLTSGFHQIPLEDKSRELTAFSSNQGHFEFLRMPFGLKNAPATFQRMMDNALRGLIGQCCLVYLDDVIIFGKNLEEHNQKLQTFLQRLRETGLQLQPDKCEYLKPELQYLGHIITADGVRPNPDKCQAVSNFPEPKNAKQIKQFLGLAGYYRRFVPNFSLIAKPLNSLLVKGKDFIFGPEQKRSFEELKKKLCEPPVLSYPDFTQPFTLTTDASNYAIGAVLSQGEIGKDKPCAYASRTLCPAEQNYNTTEKELLAIVWGIKHFRTYLYGKHFTILTDHQPLRWLFNNKDPSSRLMRWRIMLEEYDYEIRYKRGTQNSNADALSRNPVLLAEQIHGNMSITDEPLPKGDRENLNCHIQCEPRENSEDVYTEVIDEDGIRSIAVTYNKPKFAIRKCITEEENPIYPTIHIMAQELAEINKLDLPQTLNAIRKMTKDHANKFVIHLKEINIPPEEDRKRVIKEHHDEPLGGHRGINKTFHRLVENYYWPTMKSDVEKYVKRCTMCQKVKITRRPVKMPLAITDTPTRFNEKIGMDIVGPLPETKRKNRFILTVQCLLTKYCWAWPLESYTSQHCADAFLKNYVSNYGHPRTILTDNGANFNSKFMQHFEKLIGMRHVTATPYHPQSNGSLERSHQMLKDYLRSYANRRQDNWDDYLPLATFNYNTSRHEGTGYTPYELVYGRKAEDPTVHRAGRTYDEYLQQLEERIRELQGNASQMLKEAKENTKERYDRYARPHNFKVGDLVWVKKELRVRGLHYPYEGPYEITEIPNETNLLLKKDNHHIVVHADRCKFANINIFQERSVEDEIDNSMEPGPSQGP